eukprot:superscaffoldBa00003922_g17955
MTQLSTAQQQKSESRAEPGNEGAEAEILSEAAPVVVWRLIDAIEKHGVSSESLYRAPAASGGPAELRQALDSGRSKTLLNPNCHQVSPLFAKLNTVQNTY